MYTQTGFHPSIVRSFTGLLLLSTVLAGCGGGSSSDAPSVAVQPLPLPPPSPPQEPLFQLSFPPALSRTEAASISIVGRLTEGVTASSVVASIGGQETTLSASTDGEWRGELPLTDGANSLSVVVSPMSADEQALNLATINRGLLLGFPNDLVVLGDRAYTLDRGGRSALGLSEIDLATGVGRRDLLNPAVDRPVQLLGEVNGELLVRNVADNLGLLDLSVGTVRFVSSLIQQDPQGRVSIVVLDESSNRVYGILDSTEMVAGQLQFTNQVVFVAVDGVLPATFNESVDIEALGAGSFLGLNQFNNTLLFQAFSSALQDSRPLLAINVETGARSEQLVSFQGMPFTAAAALAEPDGLVLADSLGQIFRLEGDSLMAISLLASAEEQAFITSLVAFDEQWLVLDGMLGNIFIVNPENGNRTAVLTSTNGSGPRSPGWHGLLFDNSRDELLGISFIGAQAVDARTGDRSSGTAIEFEPISAGPNFIALPPLADGLSIDADGSNLWFARVTNVAMGPSDIVRLNLATGVSETVATVNSRAPGTLLPRFPTVITEASRQLAWFFDVDEDRSLSRIDLVTGAATDLVLSVRDQPLLSVLADPVNQRLLYASLALAEGENRLDIIALDDDGQMPETLASIVVDPDATAVTDPRIQMALSQTGDVLYVPLPATERIAVIDLVSGEGRVVGDAAAPAGAQSIRFSTGLSAAVAPDGRLFLVNGDSGIRAIDAISGSEVVLSR